MVGFKVCIEVTLVREKENIMVYFVFFLLGDSPASEFYVLTFRNTLVYSIFIGDVRMKNVLFY